MISAQLQQETSLQQVKDVWRISTNAQEEEGVDSFDWIHWMCRTWSSNRFGVLLTHQTRRHIKQDQKPRALGDVRSVETTEAHNH